MDVHTLGHVDNELDVCVVVVICAARDFDVVVSHADVVGVGLQILWGGHDGEVDGALVAKRLIRPFSDGSDLLDGGNTVVGNENLRRGLALGAGHDRWHMVGLQARVDLRL